MEIDKILLKARYYGRNTSHFVVIHHLVERLGSVVHTVYGVHSEKISSRTQHWPKVIRGLNETAQFLKQKPHGSSILLQEYNSYELNPPEGKVLVFDLGVINNVDSLHHALFNMI